MYIISLYRVCIHRGESEAERFLTKSHCQLSHVERLGAGGKGGLDLAID